MSPELTGILAVGIGLSGLMIGMFAWLRQDMGGRIERLENRTSERFDKVDTRFDRLENRLAAVEHGQAKLEGLLEGLREAIVGCRAAS